MTPLEILSRRFRRVDFLRGPRLSPQGLCAIYLLVSSEEIRYVGASINLGLRLYEHRHSRTLGRRPVRGHALILPLSREMHPRYEGALIRAFLPSGNRICPSPQGHDDAVLAGLGLPPQSDRHANERAWIEELQRRSFGGHPCTMANFVRQLELLRRRVEIENRGDAEFASWRTGAPR